MENVKEQIHEDFEKLKSDKENYFEQFYKNNYNFVYRICFSILKDKENSEDVTQVVFEKLYKMPTENLATNYESSWLYTVAKNESIQFIRKNKFHDSLDEGSVIVEDNQNKIDEIEINEDYKKIVNKLNKKQEQIVSLKVLSEFTFKEIGLMMSMPTATVQWYYYSSIKSLKAAIGSMAMFVVALALGVRLWYKTDKNETNNDSNYHKKTNKAKINEQMDSSSETSNSKNIESLIQNSKMEDTVTSTETPVSYGETSSNMAKIGLFSLAGIFLVGSIVFSIIFIKKARKKSVINK